MSTGPPTTPYETKLERARLEQEAKTKISIPKIASTAANIVGSKILGSQVVKDILAGRYNEAGGILAGSAILGGGSLLGKYFLGRIAEEDKKKKAAITKAEKEAKKNK
jgi:hypothetical protein